MCAFSAGGRQPALTGSCGTPALPAAQSNVLLLNTVLCFCFCFFNAHFNEPSVQNGGRVRTAGEALPLAPGEGCSARVWVITEDLGQVILHLGLQFLLWPSGWLGTSRLKGRGVLDI